LPGLAIEIEHRKSPGAEQLSIHPQAVPALDAFGLETASQNSVVAMHCGVLGSGWCLASEVRDTLRHPLTRTSDVKRHWQPFDLVPLFDLKFL
jgi:hypothetical protein